MFRIVLRDFPNANSGIGIQMLRSIVLPRPGTDSVNPAVSFGKKTVHDGNEQALRRRTAQRAVKERSQVLNPKTGRYVKRDAATEKFMDVKQDGTPFRSVRKEK